MSVPGVIDGVFESNFRIDRMPTEGAVPDNYGHNDGFEAYGTVGGCGLDNITRSSPVHSRPRHSDMNYEECTGPASSTSDMQDSKSSRLESLGCDKRSQNSPGPISKENRRSSRSKDSAWPAPVSNSKQTKAAGMMMFRTNADPLAGSQNSLSCISSSEPSNSGNRSGNVAEVDLQDGLQWIGVDIQEVLPQPSAVQVWTPLFLEEDKHMYG